MSDDLVIDESITRDFLALPAEERKLHLEYLSHLVKGINQGWHAKPLPAPKRKPLWPWWPRKPLVLREPGKLVMGLWQNQDTIDAVYGGE